MTENKAFEATSQQKAGLMVDSPRILLYDIETSPLHILSWTLWNIDYAAHLEQDTHLLSIAWKWLGERQTHVLGLDDFPKRFAKDSTDDYELAAKMAALFDEADMVVAHNGRAFDSKKVLSRLIQNGFPPPSPFKDYDTLKAAKAIFAFTSNRLDDICKYLGFGQKLATGGIDLWRGCEAGDPKAWAKMKKYNKHDVILLEELYYRIRTWDKRHPNLATMADRPHACPVCLSEEGMIIRGYSYNAVTKRAKFQCKACGKYTGARKTERVDTNFVVQ